MFPEFSFSSINCNSLNMSLISSNHQRLKIYGIVKLKTDFILLSDIRLNTANNGNNVQKLQNIFQINPYQSYNLLHNSVSNSRGVGVLIKNNLNVTAAVVDGDVDCNIIAVRMSTAGKDFLLICIYGPNKNSNTFFPYLSNILSRFKNIPVIIGGDWNCTVSTLGARNNPDIFNMVDVPNLRHSRHLSDICAEFSLCDPFRCFHPHRSDFSYISRISGNDNKSRIDFFIVSQCLFANASECYIVPCLQNKLFDHKAVMLNFKKVRSGNKVPIISDTILGETLLPYIISISAVECYILHSVIPVTKKMIGVGLAELGHVRGLIRCAGPDDRHLLHNPRNENEKSEREYLFHEIHEIVSLINWDAIYDLALDIEDDLFLEYFINVIRNEVISFQSHIFKVKNKEISEIELELATLKNDYLVNAARIKILEQRLNSYSDTLMKNEIIKFKIFENLNNEKITPFFIKLAKCSDKSQTLKDLKDMDGNHFVDSVERGAFISDFYAKLYKKPSSDPANYSGCIEEFLGPEIVNSAIVRDSKLNETEKRLLESEISLEELDAALKEANKKSAPGLDGLSLRFIEKFWNIFRVPLHKYALCCFGKGSLSDTFRSAVVRLIPKKGDTSNLKNWRPISLLSNMYKLISRVLNNRLTTVMSKITSRAQKGFTDSRYLQEVLINVIEVIGHCGRQQQDGLLVAVDMAKAFDTLSHGYLLECYKFFNFGTNFTNMLETVGSNRRACIKMEDDSLSPYFPLETGRPQGEILSPNQYNMGNQILLFKIELCPEIASVFQHCLGPHRPFPIVQNLRTNNKNFSNESHRETDKAEGFADDTTAIMLSDGKSLVAFKNILANFSVISGLHTNYEKTILIPIGSTRVVVQTEPFLEVSESFTVLGMQIDNKLQNLGKNFDSVIKKMGNIVTFWDRFNLSLPGRISVAKTFLLSLLSHIGCILMPSDQQLDDMQKISDNFCMGKLNVSKEKRYKNAENGGLGLINFKEFLTAQHTIWFKRAAASTRDNWRIDLWDMGHGNPYTVDFASIDKNEHPILHGLTHSFFKFVEAYTAINDNYKDALIFNNPCFKRSNDDQGILDFKFFNNGGNPNFFRISSVKFRDCFYNGFFREYRFFTNDLGLGISLATYFRLRQALMQFIAGLKRKRLTDGSSVSLSVFFNSFKKGSKSCRRVLNSHGLVKVTELTTVNTFFNLLNEGIPDEIFIKRALGLWGTYSLPNTFREFIFKFFNNKLGLNTRVSHFTNKDRLCTFCQLLNNDTTNEEDFLHLFFLCPVVRPVQLEIFNTILVENGLLDASEQKLLWFGICKDKIGNKFKTLFYLGIQYQIWMCKLKRIIPNSDFLVGETIHLLDGSCSMDNTLDNAKNNFNSNLSRFWPVLRQPRW